jgi:hypothetical protein
VGYMDECVCFEANNIVPCVSWLSTTGELFLFAGQSAVCAKPAIRCR